jgi:3-hydroxyisobutyrate dehydrogenase-like beta-hydroxyacid dehydrogenase
MGVIGLGRLGAALSRRLAGAGNRVSLYDLDGDKRRAFSGAQALTELAPSLTDFGHDCDVIFSALPDIASLRSAAFGDSDRPGFALAMQPGSVIAHFGSGPYKDVLHLTGQLGSGGIGLIDVLACHAIEDDGDQPVDMLVGGFGDLIERARPALRAIGPVQRVGATGTATGLAALRGYVRAARLIALSEAMLIGHHAGIEPETLARVFDGPIATGPECRVLANGEAIIGSGRDLARTCRALADAVGFSEQIGVSGEYVAFAHDMLSDALNGHSGGDERALLQHFTAMTSDA